MRVASPRAALSPCPRRPRRRTVAAGMTRPTSRHPAPPLAATISDVETSGSATFSTAPEEHSHNGLQVFYGVLELLPRTDATVTYTVTTSAEAGDQPLTVRTTPTCQVAR